MDSLSSDNTTYSDQAEMAGFIVGRLPELRPNTCPRSRQCKQDRELHESTNRPIGSYYIPVGSPAQADQCISKVIRASVMGYAMM